MKKMKNNPFKLWGTYVGALISAVPTISVVFAGLPNGIRFFYNILTFPVGIISQGGVGVVSDIIRFSIYAVYGFLIGWGIHVLIKKYWGK